MRRTRFILVALFAMTASFALWVSRGEADPGTVQKITDGVWLREGDLKTYGHCNNVIIEMKDYLIVVDANFPSGARLAMEAAKGVSSKPVKYVFDTHHHGDHAYGNSVWAKAGATTLAYVGVAQEMKRYEPKRWQDTAKTREDVRELNEPSVAPPMQTFDKSPFVLDDGTRRVEFHHFGWAHTRGDGFVFLPKEKLVCTGDAVVNGPYNYTGDGNVANWPNVVRAVKKLDVQRVLPGHGGPGGREVLDGQESFMVELRKNVKAEFDRKKKLEDIVKIEDGKPVSTTVKVPDSVKNWVGDGFPAQVQVVYEELAQNKPHGEILGGK